MNKTGKRLIKKATEILEQIERRNNPATLSDDEKEAINILSTAMSYSLEYIPPENEDEPFIIPSYITELGGVTALCEASVRRLQGLELNEEDKAGFISAVKQCYGVAE